MIQPNADLVVIDWNHTKKLNSKVAGLTEDLLQLFIQQLPIMQTAITEAFAKKDMAALYDQLHKLQGSCTYCGLKRLADLVAQISHGLKECAAPEQTWLTLLNQEIELVKTELLAKGFSL